MQAYRIRWLLLLATFVLLTSIAHDTLAQDTPPLILDLPGDELTIEVDARANNTDVVVVQNDTGIRKPIYSVPGAIPADLLVLSPNGQYAAFVEVIDQETGLGKIVFIDLETNISRDLVLPAGDSMPTNPIWSPDSTRLAYVWINFSRATVELWTVAISTGQSQRLVAEDPFWVVLSFGKTDLIDWEDDGRAVQFFNERSGQIYRVTLDGKLSEVATQGRVMPSLANHLQTASVSAAYDGMVKPLNIRDYDDTCGDGYTGLYPDYGGCVLTGPHPGVDMHNGSTNIGCGTSLVAICSGDIVGVRQDASAATHGVCGNNIGATVNHGLGWTVVLRCQNIPDATLSGTTYGGTIYAVYAHMSQIDVSSGQSVAKGQKVGEVGSTGQSDGAHLHFQMERDNQPNHPWYWSTTSAILTYTWNPMYFIQAHEGWDAIAPTTSFSLSGTSGENGWYRSSVQVTLSASDNSGGSGVQLVQYKVDDGSWTTYSSPFTVSGEDTHTVRYKAQDKAGNWESERQIAVRIDITSPTGSLAINNGAATAPGVLVQVSPSASDATSGVYQMRLRDAGGSWSSWQSYDCAFWQLPAVTGSAHTVEIQFKDRAGNLSSVYNRSITLDIYPARPASSNYRLGRSTWGVAPWDRQSSNYRLRGTAGQPSMIGILSSANYRLKSGYWAFPLLERKVYLPLVLR